MFYLMMGGCDKGGPTIGRWAGSGLVVGGGECTSWSS